MRISQDQVPTCDQPTLFDPRAVQAAPLVCMLRRNQLLDETMTLVQDALGPESIGRVSAIEQSDRLTC